MNVDNVARMEKVVRIPLPGPGKVIRAEDKLLLPDARGHLVGQDIGHQGVHIRPELRRLPPIRMTEVIERASGREHIQQVALPSVTALQPGQPIQHGAIGCLLQIQVQGGVDPQAFVVNLLAAKLTFQFTPHVLHEPGSNAVGRRLDVQAERRGLGGVGLRVGDHSVFQHGVDHHVAAAEGTIRVDHGRIGYRPFRQSGQQGRFRARSDRARAC